MTALVASRQHTALIFPGQGSQKKGLLAELSSQFPHIQATFAEAHQVLGVDLWAIAQDGDPRLDQTAYTQPILLSASVALWRLWQELGGVQPALVAGHSLGEYSALVVAGVLGFDEAVQLVHQRGLLMQQAVPDGGAMAAVLGLADAEVVALCAALQAGGHAVSAANFNAPGQVVVAGTTAAVAALAAQAKAHQAKVLPLPVSVPSHCALMQPAAEALAAMLEKTAFADARMPVVQNVDAQPSRDAAVLRQGLIDQLTQPVRWTQTLEQLARQGIQQLVECGPGNVLSNLAKRLPEPLPCHPIDTRSRLDDALAAVLMAEGKLA